MFGKKIIFSLILLSMMLMPLLSQDSQNLEKLVDELEMVIAEQTKLLNEQQAEINNLVILSAEQVQELSEVNPELKKSNLLVIEQQAEIKRLQILQDERPEFFQNYVQVSEDTIIALRDQVIAESKKLVTSNTIKDVSLICNVIQGIALTAIYASR